MYPVTLKTFPSPSWLLSSSTPPLPFCPTKTSIITHNLVAFAWFFCRPASFQVLGWIWQQGTDNAALSSLPFVPFPSFLFPSCVSSPFFFPSSFSLSPFLPLASAHPFYCHLLASSETEHTWNHHHMGHWLKVNWQYSIKKLEELLATNHVTMVG